MSQTRKRPKQERSRATVEALLDATAALLVEEGYPRTTTNRIAKRAGVSVGSLYQYFPNKEAVVAALIERFIDAQFDVLATRLSASSLDPGQPVAEQVRGLVVALLEIKKLQPELARVLFEQTPRVGKLDMLPFWVERAVAVVEAAIVMRADELRPADPALAAHLLVNAIHGIMHYSVLHRPDYIGSDAFVDEVCVLILSYLAPTGGRGA
jgi:AcrR family transcriptional regulator